MKRTGTRWPGRGLQLRCCERSALTVPGIGIGTRGTSRFVMGRQNQESVLAVLVTVGVASALVVFTMGARKGNHGPHSGSHTGTSAQTTSPQAPAPQAAPSYASVVPMTDGAEVITEDGISKICDVSFTRKRNNIKDVPPAEWKPNSIVCITGQTYLLDRFFREQAPHLTSPIILLTIEMDFLHTTTQMATTPFVKKWYTCKSRHELSHLSRHAAEALSCPCPIRPRTSRVSTPCPLTAGNKPCSMHVFTGIPEGLNKDRHGAAMSKFIQDRDTERPKQENMLLINFTPHKGNKERQHVMDLGKTAWASFAKIVQFKKGGRSIVKSNTDFSGAIPVDTTALNWYKTLASYKFVVSPRGKGEDCHRTWEALYVGAIPIMRKSCISDLFVGLPVLIVDHWENITLPLLEAFWAKRHVYSTDMGKLKLSYWREKILAAKALPYLGPAQIVNG